MSREHLITTLMELAGDEYASKEDVLVLAKETDEQIMQKIIDAAHYYKNEML